MERKTDYNLVAIALIYYEVIGEKYLANNKSQRDLARSNFRNAKKNKTLDKEVLNKALEKYFEKIKQDFE
jgi:hypothetical protein